MLAWPYLLEFLGEGGLRFRHLVGFDVSGSLGLGKCRGGLCVCVADSSVSTEMTEAQYWLQGTDEVSSFIARLAELSVSRLSTTTPSAAEAPKSPRGSATNT